MLRQEGSWRFSCSQQEKQAVCVLGLLPRYGVAGGGRVGMKEERERVRGLCVDGEGGGEQRGRGI